MKEQERTHGRRGHEATAPLRPSVGDDRQQNAAERIQAGSLGSGIAGASSSST